MHSINGTAGNRAARKVVQLARAVQRQDDDDPYEDAELHPRQRPVHRQQAAPGDRQRRLRAGQGRPGRGGEAGPDRAPRPRLHAPPLQGRRQLRRRDHPGDQPIPHGPRGHRGRRHGRQRPQAARPAGAGAGQAGGALPRLLEAVRGRQARRDAGDRLRRGPEPVQGPRQRPRVDGQAPADEDLARRPAQAGAGTRRARCDHRGQPGRGRQCRCQEGHLDARGLVRQPAGDLPGRDRHAGHQGDHGHDHAGPTGHGRQGVVRQGAQRERGHPVLGARPTRNRAGLRRRQVALRELRHRRRVRAPQGGPGQGRGRRGGEPLRHRQEERPRGDEGHLERGQVPGVVLQRVQLDRLHRRAPGWPAARQDGPPHAGPVRHHPGGAHRRPA